jgi:hypothetical protein
MRTETKERKMFTKVAACWLVGYLSQFVVGFALAMILSLATHLALPELNWLGPILMSAVFYFALMLRMAVSFLIALIASKIANHKRAILCATILNQLVIVAFLVAMAVGGYA